MFYVFNTVTGTYICDDYASAFSGKSVPIRYSTEPDAQREITRRHWADEETYVIHTTISEEALVTYE